MQLILATIPSANESAPYIVTNQNLLLLFEIQAKVYYVIILWKFSSTGHNICSEQTKSSYFNSLPSLWSSTHPSSHFTHNFVNVDMFTSSHKFPTSHLQQVDALRVNVSNSSVSLQDICTKPTGSACATQSVLQVGFLPSFCVLCG